MPKNELVNPEDGINTPVEHKNFAMLIMNTAFADGTISARRVQKITGLSPEDAISILLDLEKSGVLKKNAVSKFEPNISKNEWYERSYDFFENNS